MAVNTTGVTPLANWIPEVWHPELADATKANIVLADRVDRSFESGVKNFGQIIHIQNRSHPAVRVKSEDTTATWANITETRQNITINRQAYSALLVEDIGELQSMYDVRASYTQDIAYSMVAYIEGDATSGLASLPSGFTNLVSTLGSDPADDDWLRARQYLDDRDVPDTDRFIYLSPPTNISLLKLARFTNADYVGATNAIKANTQGMVSFAYGAPCFMSSLANNNPSSANTSYSWFCHRKGVALVMQREPTVHTQEVILEVSMGVLVDVIYQFAKRTLPLSTLGGGTPDDAFNVGVRGA